MSSESDIPSTARGEIPDKDFILSPHDTRALRKALALAIRSCKWQAAVSLLMVILSILACISLLLLGDKVDYLFMDPAHKHALARAESAKYKLLEKLASYDDRVIEDLDPIYEKLRSEFGVNLISPTSSTSNNSAATKSNSTPADNAKPTPSVDVNAKAPDADYVDPKTVALPVEKYEELKLQLSKLQEERTKIIADRDKFEKQTDSNLREQNEFYRTKISNLEKDITGRDQRISSADQQKDSLWKAREEQNQKIGSLNEKLSGASAMAEVKSMLSTAFIRGSALFLLIWLVKIFVRKYQHAINGREFYFSSLNALRIKGIKTFAQFELASKSLRLGGFELRDADVELLSERLSDNLASIVKPLSK